MHSHSSFAQILNTGTVNVGISGADRSSGIGGYNSNGGFALRGSVTQNGAAGAQFAEISVPEEKFQDALVSSDISRDDVSEIINDMNLESICVEGKGYCYRRTRTHDIL